MTAQSGDADIDASKPLPAQFEELQSVHARLLSGTSQAEGEVTASLRGAASCRQQIDRLGLFSSNEDEDDITTSSLKYLLVPFFEGELIARAASFKAADRSKLTQHAISSYKQFLHHVFQYGLCGDVCKATVENVLDSRVPQDPQRLRTDKIARFKRRKEIETRLELDRTQQHKAARINTEVDEDIENEEDERQSWKLRIEHAVIASLDAISVLELECQMLQIAAQRPQRAEPPREAPETKKMMEELGRVAVSLRTSQRDVLRSQVFRPSHILPTLTPEQAAEIEMQQSLQAQANKPAQQRRDDKDSDDDEEVRKQRAWDDWKDDHPHGYGNSKLRPCA